MFWDVLSLLPVPMTSTEEAAAEHWFHIDSSQLKPWTTSMFEYKNRRKPESFTSCGTPSKMLLLETNLTENNS